MIHRTVREWDYLRISDEPGEAGVTRAQADRLLSAARLTDIGGADGEQVLVDGGRRLRALQVVGVLVAGDVSLEILPKIERDAASVRSSLVQMLAAVYDLEVAVGPLTELSWQSRDLLEILVRLFCDKLAGLIRRGLPRAYLRREDDVPALRGRLDAIRQFTVLAARPQSLSCRYEELDPDVALNRIVKAALVRLKSLVRAEETQRRLSELLFAYTEVTLPPRAALPWHEIVLDRSNSGWRELLGFVRLLLGNRFQTTSSGETEGFALLFEMNTLFEEFVGRTLRRTLAGTNAHVSLQGPRAYALHDLAHGHRIFATRPDIVITQGGRTTVILDTKWKRLTSAIEDRRRGVGQADIYQMMAYAQVYRCRELILIYPHHAGLHQPAGYLTAHGIINLDDSRIRLLTLDLTKPVTVRDQLRAAISLDDTTVA